MKFILTLLIFLSSSSIYALPIETHDFNIDDKTLLSKKLKFLLSESPLETMNLNTPIKESERSHLKRQQQFEKTSSTVLKKEKAFEHLSLKKLDSMLKFLNSNEEREPIKKDLNQLEKINQERSDLLKIREVFHSIGKGSEYEKNNKQSSNNLSEALLQILEADHKDIRKEGYIDEKIKENSQKSAVLKKKMDLYKNKSEEVYYKKLESFLINNNEMFISSKYHVEKINKLMLHKDFINSFLIHSIDSDRNIKKINFIKSTFIHHMPSNLYPIFIKKLTLAHSILESMESIEDYRRTENLPKKYSEFKTENKKEIKSLIKSLLTVAFLDDTLFSFKEKSNDKKTLKDFILHKVENKMSIKDSISRNIVTPIYKKTPFYRSKNFNLSQLESEFSLPESHQKLTLKEGEIPKKEKTFKLESLDIKQIGKFEIEENIRVDKKFNVTCYYF